jgi:predicted secreted hydrolase
MSSEYAEDLPMRHFHRRRLYIGLGAVSLATLSAACCPDAFYEIFAADPAVRLPMDEAPHCDGGEWWYYTGRAVTADGGGYGIEAVIFHVPHLPLLVLDEGWAAHFAVLDERTGAFTYEQTRIIERSDLCQLPSDGFDLQTSLVQMAGSRGQDHLRAAMFDGSYAVDLMLVDVRGAILYDGDGYVPYGFDDHSFYYSRPRMQASGTLQIDGEPREVSGEFWFDRQWGLDLTNPLLPWDWFSLRLDDGSDVMLYVFRGSVPPTAFGTYIPSEGEGMPLAADDFAIAPTAWWTSPHTGITYPVGWEIRITPQDLAVTVTAVANDQELDARATTLNVYWEGLCALRGTRGGAGVTGTAYVELTNYGQ